MQNAMKSSVTMICLQHFYVIEQWLSLWYNRYEQIEFLYNCFNYFFESVKIEECFSNRRTTLINNF